MKKIVAIGGGENGRILENGTKSDYETIDIDKEIIRLTGKERPNYLFICHALSYSKEIQDSYFETMKKIYGNMLGCNCKHLRSDELDDLENVKKKIEWADIIYEGGGDTNLMIKLWKKKGFDKILFEAWEKGKVICGISAGAVCWFNSCNSDTNNNEFETVDCLNWIKMFITPHANEQGRYDSTKKQLKDNKKIGIMLSNRSAIEIIDNKYRIINSTFKKKGIKTPFVIKAYWNKNKFYKKKITNEKRFKDIKILIEKN